MGDYLGAAFRIPDVYNKSEHRQLFDIGRYYQTYMYTGFAQSPIVIIRESG
jgi:hypothetical protein